MHVGERIRERRNALNMSADELAKRLKKNRATIYRYEKGEIENLPLDILEPLAIALETTPHYLMGWLNDSPSDENSGITFGDVIKTLRIQNNLSQEDFSNEIGIPIRDLKMYETGTRQVPIDIIHMAADFFGVTISDIVGASMKAGSKQSIYIGMNEKNVQHVQRWHEEFGFEPFTDEEYEKLIEYAKFLITLRKK